MGFFDNLRNNITAASQATADEAKKTVETLKVKEQIRQDKKDLKDLTYQIGQAYIDLHANDYEECFEEFFIEIAAINESIEKKERILAEMKNERVCPECGKEIPNNTNFCPHCGVGLTAEPEEVVVEPEEEKCEAGEVREEACEECEETEE